MRRARAVLQLAQRDLGVPAAACDAAIQRDCRVLSAARDARAQLETLDFLAGGNHSRVHAETFARLRRILAKKSAQATQALNKKDSGLTQLRSRLGATRDRAAKLPWHRIRTTTLLDALKRSRRRARKVAPGSRDVDGEKRRHRWRRRLRRWADQQAMVNGLEPLIKSRKAGLGSQKKLSRQAHALGVERDLKKLAETLAQIGHVDATQHQRMQQLIRRALRETSPRR